MSTEATSSGPRCLRVLHTADWHIGRALYARNRYDEFGKFLNWLSDTIRDKDVDVLVVAGDIFDNTAPSNRAQQLYYRFLGNVSQSPCRHVVVVAGNHDSPSFLDAPKELLRALNVHVVGTAMSSIEDESLVLCDETGAPELVVCAVPFLHDRDIRRAEPGESIADKERKLLEGICSHYEQVCQIACKSRETLERSIPIIATGHLFAVGGQTIEGDGVRDLYVGSLACVASSAFPTCIDYLALGHLHVPQKVGGLDTMRYSGSPLPMGFGEAGQEKSVCIVDFAGTNASVRTVTVPIFQCIERITGQWKDISARVEELAESNSNSWIEIVYEGSEIIGDLRGKLETLISGTSIEILRIKDGGAVDRAMTSLGGDESLEDLDVYDVFTRCLEASSIPEDQRADLMLCYREAVANLGQEDAKAQ